MAIGMICATVNGWLWVEQEAHRVSKLRAVAAATQQTMAYFSVVAVVVVHLIDFSVLHFGLPLKFIAPYYFYKCFVF